MKPFDKNRPQKPNSDPLLAELKLYLALDKRSTWAKANVSGLSPATLNNWQKGKVHRPQAVSMQMAARMLGLELTLTPIEGKKK